MLLVILLHLASGILCGRYSCYNIAENETSSYLEQQCINQVGGFFQLEICEDEFFSYCSPNFNNTYCSLPPTVSDLNIAYPGEPCTFDRNCLNSICLNNTCQGNPVNSQCTTGSQCDVGLYCNSTTLSCQGLVAAGGVCYEDSDCVSGCGCLNFACTKFFTATAGTSVPTCNYQNFLCTSGVCAVAELGGLVCVNAMQTDVTLPKTCLNNADCTVADKVASYSTICECGFNQNSQAFCNLAPGDPLYLQFVKYMSQWLMSSGAAKCHSSRRTSQACIQAYADSQLYITLMYYQALVNYYPMIQNNDACIQNIYTQQYWAAKAAYDQIQPTPPKPSSALLIGLALGALVVI